MSRCYIIIGNGFDRAHGAPTSFRHFGDWLLKEYIVLFNDVVFGTESTDLFSEVLVEMMETNDEYSIQKRVDGSLSEFCVAVFRGDLIQALKIIRENTDLCESLFKDDFISDLYSNIEANWFNIENLYFRYLCEYSKEESPLRKQKIEKLNSNLAELRSRLRVYLKTIEFKKDPGIDAFFQRVSILHNEIIVVDFNYTKTIDLYSTTLKGLGTNNENFVESINIHGTLKDENEIFGYGNDLNEEYQRLKKIEDNYLLTNFKTVNYVMDSNYEKLVKYLRKIQGFEVYVLGHSLGLTDRTLLKEILDHKQCSKIHIHTRKDFDAKERYADFKNLVISLTRIMDVENVVRSKITNYPEAKTFPS